MKIAIAGAGGIAGCHSNNYLRMDDAHIIAVADIRLEEARELAERHHANAYGSFAEMLENESPDIVDICTPSFLHAEMAIKAANKKFHVLCEKPMALCPEDAENMIRAAEDSGVFLMTAQVIRFWPEYVYLKKAYDEGVYGKLKYLFLSRMMASPEWGWENWFLVKERSGLAPFDLHMHDADFIAHMLGKPESVRSFGLFGKPDDSYIHTLYQYDGIVAEAEGGWLHAALPFQMTYRAVFENASLYFIDGILTAYVEGREPERVGFDKGNEIDSDINTGATDAYFTEIQYFIECVREGKAPVLCEPQSTAASVKMVQKETESMTAGKTVYI
jgi:predicted dehydrogenase